MAPKVHSIASDPDVVIVLTEPLNSSSTPHRHQDGQVQPPSFTLGYRRASTQELTGGDSDSKLSSGKHSMGGKPESCMGRPIVVPLLIEDIGIATPTTETDCSIIAEPERTQYHVSAGCLIAASSVLRNILSEAKVRDNDRIACMSAQRLDETALLAVLRIMHHQTMKVPRKLALMDLVEIATVVNAVKGEQAVQLFGEVWCQYAEEEYNATSFDGTQDPTSENTLWLWLWVFSVSLQASWLLLCF